MRFLTLADTRICEDILIQILELAPKWTSLVIHDDSVEALDIPLSDKLIRTLSKRDDGTFACPGLKLRLTEKVNSHSGTCKGRKCVHARSSIRMPIRLAMIFITPIIKCGFHSDFISSYRMSWQAQPCNRLGDASKSPKISTMRGNLKRLPQNITLQ